MKLIRCLVCKDVMSLRSHRRSCLCGESWGRYIDDEVVEVGGKTIVVAFAGSSFATALRNQPDEGEGRRFIAFVLPKKCNTVIYCNEQY